MNFTYCPSRKSFFKYYTCYAYRYCNVCINVSAIWRLHCVCAHAHIVCLRVRRRACRCVWVCMTPHPAGCWQHAARNDQRTNFIYLFPGLLDHGLRLEFLVGEGARPGVEVSSRRRHRKRWNSIAYNLACDLTDNFPTWNRLSRDTY